MTASQVLDLLQQDRPPENDLVFNHGDYCLPNVIIQNDQVSGFVDLGRAGVSDRYNDLAIASRSIKYNLGPKYEVLFFEYYGMGKVNPDKIAYYRMMDELF
jgi:aminoglycoside phosphotransferase